MPTPMHIVAACALILNAHGEILLVKHPARRWEVPGGQIEEGESLIEGLQREILEEMGVTAEIGALTGVYSNVKPPTKVIFAFLGIYVSGSLTTSPESSDVRWLPRNGALSLITHPALQVRVDDMLGFAEQVIYRVYTTDPYTPLDTSFF